MDRSMAIFCLKPHAKGMVQKHLANVEIYLKNPAGVGEQVRGELTSPMGAIEMELDNIAKYNNRLEMIDKYIKDHELSSINQND